MNGELLSALVCPACQAGLQLRDDRTVDGEVESGTLHCDGCAVPYPIRRFVPRFAGPDNYSSSFGFQWNRFRRTQLDSVVGQPISRRRFFEQSQWSGDQIAGRWTLDAGCGAGRFAEVASGAGVRLVAVDYSAAVDACRENLPRNHSIDVVQADLYRLPFRPGTFEFVYCFGVLQHTPDVRGAFAAVASQVASGGRLAVDVYPQTPLNAVWPKYWVRPLTKRIRPETLFTFVQRMVALLWPVSLALGRVPRIGRRLRHALPIANYEGLLPLSPAQLKEWAILDTFDMLAPAYDQPQSVEALRAWFEEQQMDEIEVQRQGLLVGRARRLPAAQS